MSLLLLTPQSGHLKKKKRFLGFHSGWLPVLMTTVTKQRGGGRGAGTKGIHPVDGASSSKSKRSSL